MPAYVGMVTRIIFKPPPPPGEVEPSPRVVLPEAVQPGGPDHDVVNVLHVLLILYDDGQAVAGGGQVQVHTETWGFLKTDAWPPSQIALA